MQTRLRDIRSTFDHSSVHVNISYQWLGKVTGSCRGATRRLATDYAEVSKMVLTLSSSAAKTFGWSGFPGGPAIAPNGIMAEFYGTSVSTCPISVPDTP